MGAQLQKMGILKEKNGKIGDNMLMNIPQDVLMKILITFPVKSLLLLRCVDKSLNNFLKNPDFIELHMKQQRECILFGNSRQPFLSFRSYESLNEISPHWEIPHLEIPERELPRLYPREIYYSWPCNGLLVCVATRKSTGSSIVLCNPTTREFKLLPSCPFHELVPDECKFLVALGFDSNKKDYKIVVCTMEPNYKFAVYSLSSNSWRQIDHEIPKITGVLAYYAGVPLNGALHWVAEKESVDFILSFNVSSEVFQDIDLPDAIATITPHLHKRLTIINDSLAFFAFPHTLSDPETKFVEIWVMKEGSWAKQVSIHGIHTNGYYIYPCLLWKNKAILMMIDFVNLKVCTLDTQTIIDTGIRGESFSLMDVMAYKGSLVSIN